MTFCSGYHELAAAGGVKDAEDFGSNGMGNGIYPRASWNTVKAWRTPRFAKFSKRLESKMSPSQVKRSTPSTRTKQEV